MGGEGAVGTPGIPLLTDPSLVLSIKFSLLPHLSQFPADTTFITSINTNALSQPPPPASTFFFFFPPACLWSCSGTQEDCQASSSRGPPFHALPLSPSPYLCPLHLVICLVTCSPCYTCAHLVPCMAFRVFGTC